MRFASIVLRVAAVYGILGLVPQYFLEERMGRDFPPPLNHPEHYYAFLGVALAWQIAFLIMARDPVRFRPLLIPAALEKLGFGLAVAALAAQGRAPQLLLLPAVIDLLFAGLFLESFRRTALEAVPRQPSLPRA
jgi:hypothetical protein